MLLAVPDGTLSSWYDLQNPRLPAPSSRSCGVCGTLTTTIWRWVPHIMSSPQQPQVDHSRDGESKIPEIIGIVAVCTVLSTAVVVLRSITRIWITGGFGADDWALVFAQVREFEQTCVSLVGGSGGEGVLFLFTFYSARLSSHLSLGKVF